MKDQNYNYSIKKICSLMGISRQAVMQRISKSGVKGVVRGKYKERLFTEYEYLIIKNYSIDIKRIEVIYVQETYWIIPSKLNFM